MVMLFFNKIFQKQTTITHDATNSKYSVKNAIKIMSDIYKAQWSKSAISSLFNMSWESTEDFTSLEKLFLEQEMVASVQDFRENFRVEEEHLHQKKTIDVCLDFYENLKVLYVFSSLRSLKNENRDAILKELADFFEDFTLDSSTQNESFLKDTLNRLRQLPVDCCSLDASVALEYVMSQLCSLGNIQSDEELRLFLSLFKNCCVRNVNHNYIAVRKLIFCSHSE